MRWNGAYRRTGACAVIVGLLLTPSVRGGDRDAISWRSPPANLPLKAENASTPGFETDQQHVRRVVLRLNCAPTDRQRRELAAGGVTLLSPLGGNAFFARIDASHADSATLSQRQLIEDIQPIDAEVKLHPALSRGEPPGWLVAESTQSERVVGTYVMFHRDVDLESEAVPLMSLYGVVVLDVLESVNSLVVELPLTVVHDLATEDIVQWIEPAAPRLAEANDSSRALTQADQARVAPYNLDGAGVSVMVYDGGTARETHIDFGGRLTVRDAAGMTDHATHVAGIIGGGGAASSGVFSGMAPAVTIESYGFDWDATGIYLYSNPGDLESDYDDAINNHGVVIANNSIGSNTAINWDCDITGDYGVTSALIDAIVCGSLNAGEPFRVVWAAGNERVTDRCGDTWRTTAPPGGAKNPIVVGAINSNDESMTYFSSWGPVDDGRIKPDLVAPGCQSDGDGGVTSCSAAGDDEYTTKCGTSMAAPAVTGVCALLIQDYRAQFPGRTDPRNSTLKALLAHSARDLGAPGPDYKFGYGSVRVANAIDLVRDGAFAEHAVGQDESVAFEIVVAPGAPEFKVTLAWDDPPATLNVSRALVNDLDLRVYDPSSSRCYPWTLDPDSPAAPAVRIEEDHVNNIEQVLVADPAPGVWRIYVFGHDTPTGPQPFSICVTPSLAASDSADCNGNGVSDDEEIATGVANDVNSDGVPDDCQCIGDFDGDYDVDLGDLAHLLSNYGSTKDATYAEGDLDADGDVDLADVAALLLVYGAVCS